MVFGLLLTLYMVGGAISALIFLRLGQTRGLITNLREQLEVAVFAWLLWPLILIEETLHSIRNYRRSRIYQLGKERRG